MKTFKCEKCFDTGCECGGIGYLCHGCCDCEAGERARENRKEALKEIALIINKIKMKNLEK